MTSKKQKIAFAQILSRLWQNKFLSSRLLFSRMCTRRHLLQLKCSVLCYGVTKTWRDRRVRQDRTGQVIPSGDIGTNGTYKRARYNHRHVVWANMNVHLIRCAIVMYSFLIIRAGDMFNTFLFLSVIKSLDHSVSVSCVDCMVACVKNADVSLLLIQYMYAVHRVTGQNVPPVSVKTSQCYRSKRPRESNVPPTKTSHVHGQNVPCGTTAGTIVPGMGWVRCWRAISKAVAQKMQSSRRTQHGLSDLIFALYFEVHFCDIWVCSGSVLISYSVRLKLHLSEFTFMLNCIEKFYF